MAVLLVLLLGRRLDLIVIVVRLLCLVASLELKHAYHRDPLIQLKLLDVLLVQLEQARNPLTLW